VSGALFGLLALTAISSSLSSPLAPVLNCTGEPVQGGALICQTIPDAAVSVSGSGNKAGTITTSADGSGLVVIGLDRDAVGPLAVTVTPPGGKAQSASADVIGRSFPTSRVDGLPPSRVTPYKDEDLKRIAREREVKNIGFSSRANLAGFASDWRWPLEKLRVSSEWGAQRILNGTAQRPHYGIDLAAPTGTPIRAPADGLVTLAENDLFFEGGLVLIDHGQGLISAYLHMSRVDVKAGQRVAAGDTLGAVGAGGRATGPHLCWRLRWRGNNLDPSLLAGPRP
jgi:murein DD-endopeptidase MepM/ murein hydrolase activator NlpD